jgi:hypothetical protein
MKRAEIRIGAAYAVGRTAISKACEAKRFALDYGLDLAKGQLQDGDIAATISTLFVVQNPQRALYSSIVGPASREWIRVHVLGIGEPYQSHMDGVRVEADGEIPLTGVRGPVELLLHWSSLRCEWGNHDRLLADQQDRRRLAQYLREEDEAERQQRLDDELHRILDEGVS